MTWKDMLTQLRANSPEVFDYFRVEVNASYKEIDGREVRVDYDYDALIIEFAEKYYEKYKPTVRIFKDSRVTATIEVYGYGSFSFPVTGDDEYFEDRLKITPKFAEFVQDLHLVRELKGIYEWIIFAYRRLK